MWDAGVLKETACRLSVGLCQALVQFASLAHNIVTFCATDVSCYVTHQAVRSSSGMHACDNPVNTVPAEIYYCCTLPRPQTP
jgi:hypothetical protein